MSLEPVQVAFDGRGLTLQGDAVGESSDPPVILLHGGGQTRHSWAATAATLAGQGFYAVSLDLRGHGDSDWAPDGDYQLTAFADDVALVAAQFERPVLVGASLGGVSSLVAVGRSRHDELARGLVLVDVAPRIERLGADRIGEFMMRHLHDGFASLDEVAAAVAAYNPHRPPPSNLEGLRKNLRERDGRLWWHWDPEFVIGGMGSPDETRALDGDEVFAGQHQLLVQSAGSLTIPTLLIRGRESDLLSAEGAADFLELVPHAEYVGVVGAGHMVAGDRNDAFNEAIVEFVTRLG